MANSSEAIVDLSIEVIDEQHLTEVIDLTVESPPASNTFTAFIDLTTPCSGYSTRQSRANRRSLQRENRPPVVHHMNAISFISDDSDTDLEILPILPNPTLTERNETLNASTDETLASPRKEIVCPVCMESERMIKRQRQLVSTVCGHIFCNVCIVNSIKNQHKCPTCRKKLTLKQFHPIFL
ncbi:E3 ubiquitin-protein ligase RNF4-like [Antedon mediterranea]|uniref:E3 ubiquitin-protein ligase RNF4-like n=1 Tax=Antedon mediterranea TaxID=105859 RepID=UPI003AF5A82D